MSLGCWCEHEKCNSETPPKSQTIEVFGGYESSKGQSVWRHHNNTCMRALRWERNWSMEEQRFAHGPRQRRKSISFWDPGKAATTMAETTRTARPRCTSAIGGFSRGVTDGSEWFQSWATVSGFKRDFTRANARMATNAPVSCAIEQFARYDEGFVRETSDHRVPTSLWRFAGKMIRARHAPAPRVQVSRCGRSHRVFRGRA
jgi:hypothetical protein